ncbi:MAG TPA: cysteine--tRNA ligase [Candidatus Krumholzibacteria bacterium]|nr:cysteine--tRNA ligase [Candidatus Krumholzibacteria bacterium]
MGLRMYDTLTRREHEFEPVRPGEVGLYVCGMTVQDKPHIGHFLPFLTADVLRRWLEHRGFRVNHVQNFTDIDDKIIARARQEGTTPEAVAERNIKSYYEAARAMNLLIASHYPRVTEHIGEIVRLIERLIERGHAYAAPGGDVYFRVRSFRDYGKLSGRGVDDMLSGARIEVGEQKEDALDFALWKAAKPGEPQWPSPWGNGRPGWHIECSAMAMKYLGESLDVHGGGMDLVFPHHENELAQSEAATGKPFVRYWAHNGLLYTGGQKMSKSLGNFSLIEELLQRYGADELRFFLLSTHFRSQAEYSEERLREASTAFHRLRDAFVHLAEARSRAGDNTALLSEGGAALRDAARRCREEFDAAMDRDFNTAAALGKVFELVRQLNRFLAGMVPGRDRAVLDEVTSTCFDLLRHLGFLAAGLPAADAVVAGAPAAVEDLARERQAARAARDWGKADVLRQEILAHGYIVEDRADGYRLKTK